MNGILFLCMSAGSCPTSVWLEAIAGKVACVRPAAIAGVARKSEEVLP